MNQPMTKTDVQIKINDLIAEYEVSHYFKNESKTNIEAVYTFPTPYDAAFIQMTSKIGNLIRTAQIMPKNKAQESYDDAISDGDSAVILEQLEPGLLSLNLGNLMPGEYGSIVLSFVDIINISDNEARFSLPTVHRPRYGRYVIEDYAIPEYNFRTENPLEVSIFIRGLLQNSEISTSISGINFSHIDEGIVLKAKNEYLDKDLVIKFKLDQQDCDINLTLLLDCSGSMTGDAILQSRQALKSIINLLTEDDRIQVIKFGSYFESTFKRHLKATVATKNTLSKIVNTIDSDLGGTNLDDALTESINQTKRYEDGNNVIIVVTDGDIQRHEISQSLELAKQENIRVFTVAVGSSAGIEALEPLSQQTNAVMERATPAESIQDVVSRHFMRSRITDPMDVLIQWHFVDNNSFELPVRKVYPGDSFMTFAWGKDKQISHVSYGCNSDYDNELAIVESTPNPALISWAGKQRYLNSSPSYQEQVALRYGLLSDRTSAVLTITRDESEKAQSLPEIVKVKSMHPAGFGVAHKNLVFGFAQFDTPAFLIRSDNEIIKHENTQIDHDKYIVPILKALEHALSTDKYSVKDFLDNLFDDIDEILKYIKNLGFSYKTRQQALELFEYLNSKYEDS